MLSRNYGRHLRARIVEEILEVCREGRMYETVPQENQRKLKGLLKGKFQVGNGPRKKTRNKES